MCIRDRSEYRLEMCDVVKTFPGVKALNHAQLKLKPGTVHADVYKRQVQNLSDSFGHMVGRIQQLMTTVREEEIVLRKTELKALQAQINPHFLYNTLDSKMCIRDRYKRMGWRLTGTVLHRYDPAEEGTFAAVYCEELEMQYRG